MVYFIMRRDFFMRGCSYSSSLLVFVLARVFGVYYWTEAHTASISRSAYRLLAQRARSSGGGLSGCPSVPSLFLSTPSAPPFTPWALVVEEMHCAFRHMSRAPA